MTEAADQSEESGVDATSPIGVDRVLELLAVFMVTTSLVGLATVLGGVFLAPQVLLASLTLTGLYAFRTRDRRSCAWPGTAPRWIYVALLVAAALFFRLPAYHYVLGGQDQGLYVNIAKYIQDSRGIRAHDRIKQQLQGTPYLGRYIQDNEVTVDSYLAGVYQRDSVNGKVEFQFYHLFPTWMALFDGLFGMAYGVYALVFFALVSVIFFYRLTLLLTGSNCAALLAGLLLALNPLHVFFSKFPVTEVPTLAFSLMGFTFLGVWWSGRTALRDKYLLIISALAFSCLFATRISGFMYAPFFVGLAMSALIYELDAHKRRTIQFWAAAVLCAYLLSVGYGLATSHSYSHDIYLSSFEPLLGEYWKSVILLLAVVVTACWIGLMLLVRHEHRRLRLSEWLRRPLGRLPGIVAWTALLIACWRIYRLGWTAHYDSDPWIGGFWHLAHLGWRSILATSLWQLVVYLGPLLPPALLLLLLRSGNDPRLQFVRWFVTGFFVYIALLQWIIPYGPYYARYLLSELVPYSMLFIVCSWAGMRTGALRVSLSLALTCSLIYAGGVSALQVGKNENDGALQALARLVAPIEPTDLILLKTRDQNVIDASQIKTPLVYTFDRPVVSVGDAALDDQPYMAKLDSLYDDIFLIAPEGRVPDGFTFLDSVRFRVMSYRQTHLFPNALVPTQNVVLNLYRLDISPVLLDTTMGFGAQGGLGRWLQKGWCAREGWGVWTSGQHAELSIDPRELPKTSDGLLLLLDARALVTAKHPMQHIDVDVDGHTMLRTSVTYPKSDFQLRIPIDAYLLQSPRRIQIGFHLPDAVSPQQIGVNQDQRVLAIALLAARFAGAPAGTMPAPESSSH